MPSLTRIYRYVRFRKGYGVHSPFAFGLINKVVEEKRAFYVFEEIEEIYSLRCPKIKYSSKYGRFLFRLVNFLGVKSVLQVGVSEGWQSMYLNAAAKHLIALDSEEGKLLKAVELNEDLKALQTMPGLPADQVSQAVEKLGSLDLLFLNVSSDEVQTKQLFELCLRYVHSDTVLVIDGIHKKRMKRLWDQIRQRKDISVTMDLHSLGLVFFNRKMHKKNYKLFF